MFVFFKIGRIVVRWEAKWEREGVWDLERSASRDSNAGHPKRNGTTCRHAAHEAIGADLFCIFWKLNIFTNF